MTWEEHEKEYIIYVNKRPLSFYQEVNKYSDAVKYADFIEIDSVISVKVVKYKYKYYVIADT